MKGKRTLMIVYLLALPSIIYIVLFKIFPLIGLQLAFKNFNYNNGLWASPFIGFQNFEFLLQEQQFWRALRNTIEIGVLHLIISFPVGVFLAVFLAELSNKNLRKFTQLVLTFPHFLSWVLVSAIAFNFFGNYGVIHNLLKDIIGCELSIFSNPSAFRYFLILSYIWKESGWDSIIFFAAICGVDKNLYDASTLDGANRIQKIFYITIPSIKNILITMFLLQAGNIFTAGFSQIYNLYNPTVFELVDVLSTYIYRITFTSSKNFGISAAASLIQTFLNISILFFAELICKLTLKESLFSDLLFKGFKRN